MDVKDHDFQSHAILIQDNQKRLADIQESKVSYKVFFWVLGSIAAVSLLLIGIICGILNYSFTRIELIESRHQSDHDKIIELKTKMEDLQPKEHGQKK